jgi:hypothetical protein
MTDRPDAPDPRDPVERRPRRSPSRSRRPRRIYLPWWALTALGALVGFATASWPGLVVGGVLGYLAWKLR